MPTPLSEATEERLVRLFRGADRLAARELLERDCAESIAGVPEMCSLDRIRLAVLKLSGGMLDGLADAVVLAQTDFRDALVAAGFGDDVQAHMSWWPG